ncbi:iron uptake transporter deferrochelatase/peroxidase subunit [Pleomorphomonas sp. JP5]|uniref:iron uptake transporter deferrochelatase/peroxidase subunit n=1 Tax=Pleomorphomonas sp. JP5 TaxID=2942998 RepID=UPI0020446CF1|nr:iron uptake transporter deferrochelatase/peroxidase subunit [Pleomorphomonas sp. JP5]MCM5560224.1 iron uptake transporter deferrochelatase/peroxidase subunit [Pleomorphomonas sp. JP5]
MQSSKDLTRPRRGLDRRRLLSGLGATALGGSLAGVARADTAHHTVADAPIANVASQLDSVPYLGRHQAGVVDARPANGMVASFDVLARDADELEALFRTLTERIAFLTVGGPVPALDPKLPPADSGLLGPVIRPDNLTITVSLGSSLFDDRPWLASLRPKHLQRMMRFPNDALDADICHGDLSVQICANTQDTTIHALRDIIKASSRQMILKWKQEGNVPVITPGPDGRAESARNFLGFRDGSANPDSSDVAEMDRVVWVGPEDGEPAWAVGGSYQAVRIIRNFVERWDRTPFGEQERIMGRTKMTGAPLDRREGSEFDVPDYVSDPEGKATPMDAHIRLANARDEASKAHIILRRPFNYSNGVTQSGQLDQGLLFICYQANLERGFITVQRKLNGEPLEEYIKPVGGGFFYTLPGIRDASDYVGSSLIAAARGA